jgi:hypothetical protein
MILSITLRDPCGPARKRAEGFGGLPLPWGSRRKASHGRDGGNGGHRRAGGDVDADQREKGLRVPAPGCGPSLSSGGMTAANLRTAPRASLPSGFRSFAVGGNREHRREAYDTFGSATCVHACVAERRLKSACATLNALLRVNPGLSPWPVDFGKCPNCIPPSAQ